MKINKNLYTECTETLIAVIDKNYHTKDELEEIERMGDTELAMYLEEDDSQTTCSYGIEEFLECMNINGTECFNDCYFRTYEHTYYDDL